MYFCNSKRNIFNPEIGGHFYSCLITSLLSIGAIYNISGQKKLLFQLAIIPLVHWCPQPEPHWNTATSLQRFHCQSRQPCAVASTYSLATDHGAVVTVWTINIMGQLKNLPPEHWRPRLEPHWNSAAPSRRFHCPSRRPCAAASTRSPATDQGQWHDGLMLGAQTWDQLGHGWGALWRCPPHQSKRQCGGLRVRSFGRAGASWRYWRQTCWSAPDDHTWLQCG